MRKIGKLINYVKEHIKDPLYRNSIFMMLTYATSAGFGFAFWLLAAEIYPQEDVGTATALISSMTLLVLLSRFGLDYSLIRFFPERDKSLVLSTSTIVSSVFAILLGAIFVSGISVWSPNLVILNPINSLLYIIFLVANSMVVLIGNSFIAMRRAEYNFLQYIVMGSRLFFLIPFMVFGAIGIFGAMGISLLLAVIVSIFLLGKFGIRAVLKLDRQFLDEAFAFSASNFFVDIFMIAPSMILPIMVLNVLGAKESASYYIIYSLVSLMLMIPTSISMSLLVEGCHGIALKHAIIKSLAASFSLIIPIIAVVFLYGESLLGVINPDYLVGSDLLKIMVFSGIFVTIMYIYFSIKRLQKDMKGMLLLSGLMFIMIIGFGYIFMNIFGLVGIGYAWFTAYGTGVLVLGGIIAKNSYPFIHLTNPKSP